MRQFQVTLFIVAAVSLIASALAIGKSYGETLYNTGIAMLLFDVVCIQLWPSVKRL